MQLAELGVERDLRGISRDKMVEEQNDGRGER